MALQPNSFNGQDKLQPGARGETFQADLPGYRDQTDNRLNRTNNKLATNAHDVPNIKYEFDRRLPVLFRYGFAYGYNQIVIPKGRIVAADPNMDLLDFDMRHKNNTLTLANGGAPVRLRKTGDTYRAGDGESALVDTEKQGEEVLNVGKDWIPLIEMDAAYTKLSYRPFKATGPNAQLTANTLKVDEATGKVVNSDGTAAADVVRVGNIPLGILSRNEYTRDDDAYNGMMPGAVMTDAMVELPWFAYKNKAEQNPWGSAYGGLFPGALVKSDENGRLVVSPLSFPETEMVAMTITEYELERQQVIGQVYSVDNTLIPEGAAKWATWALSDRMNFEEFNPAVWAQNGRTGEDAVSNSPYNSTGEYPGYPYDKSVTENDLNMLASSRGYSNRMDPAYQYENLGIPGLTDGHNAHVRAIGPEQLGIINQAAPGLDYVDMYFRTSEVNIDGKLGDNSSLQLSVNNATFATAAVGGILTAGDLPAVTKIGQVVEAEATTKITLTTGSPADWTTATEAQKIEAQNLYNATIDKAFLTVKYIDLLQGIVVLVATNKDKANAYLTKANGTISVKAQYNKRGLAGVPTFLDWDGCVGRVKVLLTK